MKKSIIFLFVLSLLYSCSNDKSFRELYQKDHYRGIIIKIYWNKDNHGMGTFSVRTDSSEFEEIADFYSQSWDYAKVGDSIIKPIDTLMIIIKRNDSTFKEFHMDDRFLQ
jgi:hypothetical protein